MGAQHILSVFVHLIMIKYDSAPEQNVHDRKNFQHGECKKKLCLWREKCSRIYKQAFPSLVMLFSDRKLKHDILF
jgi:hypothetical protein